MQEQVYALARQYLPWLIPFIPFCPEGALLAIIALLAAYAAGTIWQKFQAIRQVREVVRSTLSSPEVQQANDFTLDQGFAWDQGIEIAERSTMELLAAEFAVTTFPTKETLDEAAVELDMNHDLGLISDALWAVAANHGRAEADRLAGITISPVGVVVQAPPAPTVTPTVPTVYPTPLVTPGAIDMSPVAGAMERGLSGVGAALAGALPLIGTMVATGIGSIGKNLGHDMSQGRNACMSTTFPQILAQILPGLVPLGMMAFLESPEVKRTVTDPISKKLFDLLLTMPELQHPITPDEAPQLARVILERAISLGIGAHLVAQMSEASVPLKTMGMGYLAAFLADLAGFSRIASATMGALETQALRIPMTYHINEVVRSLLPDIRTAQQLLGERRITRDQFNTLMAYNGMAPEYVDGYAQLAYRPPAPRLLQQIADSGIYDEAYFRHALESSQYDDATIAQVLSGLYNRAHGALSTLMVGTAIKRFKEGIDSETALTTNLGMLAVKPALMPKYLYAAQLEKDYDDFMDYLATLKAAVAKKAISPSVMEQMLVSRGMMATKAKGYADRATIGLLTSEKAAVRDTSVGLTVQVAEAQLHPEPKARETSVGLTLSVGQQLTITKVLPRPTSVGLTTAVKGG